MTHRCRRTVAWRDRPTARDRGRGHRQPSASAPFDPEAARDRRSNTNGTTKSVLAARWESNLVCCYATLNADKESYAAPGRIPQGTPRALCRQSQHFLKDLGFDYIWFSNGFGWPETWKTTGPMFDGKTFSVARAIREKI